MGFFVFLRECWIIYGFRGVLVGIRYKFLCILNRLLHFG